MRGLGNSSGSNSPSLTCSRVWIVSAANVSPTQSWSVSCLVEVIPLPPQERFSVVNSISRARITSAGVRCSPNKAFCKVKIAQKIWFSSSTNPSISGYWPSLPRDVERVNVVKFPLEVVALVAETVVKQVFEGRNLRMVQPQPVAFDFRRVQSYDFVFGFRFRGKLSY